MDDVDPGEPERQLGRPGLVVGLVPEQHPGVVVDPPARGHGPRPHGDHHGRGPPGHDRSTASRQRVVLLEQGEKLVVDHPRTDGGRREALDQLLTGLVDDSDLSPLTGSCFDLRVRRHHRAVPERREPLTTVIAHAARGVSRVPHRVEGRIGSEGGTRGHGRRLADNRRRRAEVGQVGEIHCAKHVAGERRLPQGRGEGGARFTAWVGDARDYGCRCGRVADQADRAHRASERHNGSSGPDADHPASTRQAGPEPTCWMAAPEGSGPQRLAGLGAGDGDQPHRQIPRRGWTTRSGLVQQLADAAKLLDLGPAPCTRHQMAQHQLPVGVSESAVDERRMKLRQLGAAGFLHADLAGSRPGCLGSTVREG